MEGKISDAIVTALRRQRIASHLRIRRIEVLPEYSIADDAHLLAAEVVVRARLLFADADNAG